MHVRELRSCSLLVVTLLLHSGRFVHAELLDVEDVAAVDHESDALAGDEGVPSFGDLRAAVGRAVPDVRHAAGGLLDHLRFGHEQRYSSTTPAPFTRARPKPIHTYNILDWRRRTSSYVSLFFSIVIAVIFIRYSLFGESETAILAKAADLRELENTYVLLMQDIEKKVSFLCDHQVDWSQQIFNTKKNDFVEFMHRIRSHPERYSSSSSELVVPFKNLVKAWLHMFREVAIDPAAKPFTPISDNEIDSCGSITEISEVLTEKMLPLQVHFVDFPQGLDGNRNPKGSVWQVDAHLEESRSERKEFLEKVVKRPYVQRSICAWMNFCGNNPSYLTSTIKKHQTLGSGCFPMERKCGSLFRVNILTFMHLLLIVLFFIIHGCLATNLALKAHVAVLYSALACLLNWWLLFRFELIDLSASLRILSLHIHAQKDDMIKKGREIAELMDQVELPSQVWIYQTRPKLEIFAGYTRKISNSKWPDAQQLAGFIETILEATAIMQNTGGTPHQFAKCDYEGMKICKQSYETYAEFIQKGTAREVKLEAKARSVMPKMIAVRVVGCSELPKGNVADDYDPYVRMRTKKTSRWLQTMARQDETDPKWHTPSTPCEFRLLLNGTETELEVEVMDENNIASDTFIGAAPVPLKELDENGSWQMVSKSLEDCDTGKVALEIFLVTNLKSLRTVLNAPGRRKLHSIEDSDDPPEDCCI